MHFQYVVAAPTLSIPVPPSLPVQEGDQALLRELIEVQKEQLSYMRAAHEAQNSNNRWQAFLNRWSEEFPGIGEDCRTAFPHIERAFLQLVEELTRRVADEDEGSIEDEFSLNEFLDRFGTRLSQLGNLLNILGPLAEAARTNKEST